MVWKFGLISLWVPGYSFSNVHADRYCDPKDARLAVHLYTTDSVPADCAELNHQNQGGPKKGFLTLADSIDFVLCPGCLTLSDSCVVRRKDGDV